MTFERPNYIGGPNFATPAVTRPTVTPPLATVLGLMDLRTGRRLPIAPVVTRPPSEKPEFIAMRVQLELKPLG
jgi:hypothetical protein